VLDHEGVAVAERHAAAVPIGAHHPIAALRKVAALPRVGLGGRVTGAAHDGSAVVLVAVGITEPETPLSAAPVVCAAVTEIPRRIV
jgi:hypothetical protein